jgi:hypothetical protein
MFLETHLCGSAHVERVFACGACSGMTGSGRAEHPARSRLVAGNDSLGLVGDRETDQFITRNPLEFP